AGRDPDHRLAAGRSGDDRLDVRRLHTRQHRRTGRPHPGRLREPLTAVRRSLRPAAPRAEAPVIRTPSTVMPDVRPLRPVLIRLLSVLLVLTCLAPVSAGA